MKKYVFLFLTLVFTFHFSAKAQDTMHIKMGFFFNPQGSISLQTPEKGFSAIVPIFFVTQFVKGKGGVNVMYNMTYNNAQVAYFHKLCGSLGTYLLINKHVLSNGGYVSAGVTRSLADGRANGFFEFGSAWDHWSPVIYTGLIIPFTMKVK